MAGSQQSTGDSPEVEGALTALKESARRLGTEDEGKVARREAVQAGWQPSITTKDTTNT
jgi:hypothetical protein